MPRKIICRKIANTLPRIDPLESRAYLSVTFTGPTYLNGVLSPTGIATGDMNGDGKPDLIVAGTTQGVFGASATIYPGKGDGTFGAPMALSLFGATGGVAVGDFSGNGKLDVAAVDGGGTAVDVFINQDGTNYTRGGGSALPGSANQTAIAAGDFNGDGKADVAVSDPQDNQVQILYSKGDGSFASQTPISVPAPGKIIVGDFNGDGHPDLAVLSGGSTPAIFIVLNGGAGAFQTPVSVPLGGTINDFGVADLNGDGHPDLFAAAVDAASNVPITSVSFNKGDGTFYTPTVIPMVDPGILIGAGTFTGGSSLALDVIGSDGSLTTFANDGKGNFSLVPTTETTPLGSPATQAVVGDFNADGNSDIAYLSNGTSGAVGVLINGIPQTQSGGTSVITPALSATLPAATVVAGKIKPIHLKLTLTNSSATTVKGKVTVNVSLSAQTVAAASDATVGSAVKKINLKAHGKTTVSVMVKALPTSAAGTYYLVANVVDPAGGTASVATAGTLSVAAPYVDLSGVFASVAAGGVVGKKVNAVLHVSNNGTIAASGPLEIKLFASTTGLLDAGATVLTDFTKRVSIKPGKMATLKVTKLMGQAAAGNYFLVVQLDPGNQLKDANIANNTFATLQPVAVV